MHYARPENSNFPRVRLLAFKGHENGPLLRIR